MASRCSTPVNPSKSSPFSNHSRVVMNSPNKFTGQVIKYRLATRELASKSISPGLGASLVNGFLLIALSLEPDSVLLDRGWQGVAKVRCKSLLSVRQFIHNGCGAIIKLQLTECPQNRWNPPEVAGDVVVNRCECLCRSRNSGRILQWWMLKN